MNDDFLTQIQDAEQQAQQTVEKALEKKQKVLQEYRQKLAADRQSKLGTVQEKSRTTLQGVREEARKNYEQQVSHGNADAISLESEKNTQVDGLLVGAEEILLSLI